MQGPCISLFFGVRSQMDHLGFLKLQGLGRADNVHCEGLSQFCDAWLGSGHNP